jgi:hypothetical protein
MKSIELNSTVDEVFDYYADKLDVMRRLMRSDFLTFIKTLPRFLGEGTMCLSERVTKPLYRNIKCVNCEILSKLVDGKPATFKIEYGNRKGETLYLSKHVIQTNPLDKSVVKDTRKIGNVIDLVLYNYEHLVTVQTIVSEIVETGNVIETAFVCDRYGYILNTTKKRGEFKQMLRNLFDSYFVQYDTTNKTIGEIGLLRWESVGIAIPGPNSLQLSPQHLHIENYDQGEDFVFDPRVADLFASMQLSRETERVITCYFLIAWLSAQSLLQSDIVILPSASGSIYKSLKNKKMSRAWLDEYLKM